MNKEQKRELAKLMGSKTGKLKKKHLARAKMSVRGLVVRPNELTALSELEISTLLGAK